MASKTYANLTTVTTTNDSDLVAVYPTGGPLKVIAWLSLVAKLVTDLTPTFLRRDQNLADLNSAGVARTNLGLGTSATVSTGITAGTIAVLGTGGKAPISTLPGGYLAKSSTYSAVLADNGKLIDCTGTFTLTLPDASTVGETYSIDVRNPGTGTITLAPAAGTIDGGSSATVMSGTTRTVLTDGTNYYTTPEGPQGWTLLDTKATTSGTSVTFSSISQAFSELLFEFDAVVGSANDSVFAAISSDGVSYSANWDVTGAAAGGYIGQITVERYTSTVVKFEAGLCVDAAAPLLTAPSTSLTKRVGRTASGVKYVRFALASGAYTSGAIRLYAR